MNYTVLLFSFWQGNPKSCCSNLFGLVPTVCRISAGFVLRHELLAIARRPTSHAAPTPLRFTATALGSVFEKDCLMIYCERAAGQNHGISFPVAMFSGFSAFFVLNLSGARRIGLWRRGM